MSELHERYRPSMRPFGIEIEITVPHYDRPARPVWDERTCEYVFPDNQPPDTRAVLSKEFPEWDFGWDCCAEIRSPVLTGASGMQKLEAMYARLKEVDAKAQKCCGAHTHYEANDLTKEDKAKVANAWAINEDVIKLFVDRSRWNNGMCTPVKDRIFTASYLPHKGQSINCTSHHGTIEVRKHHATTDFEEMAAWIRFCQSFIHQAITYDSLHTCAKDGKQLLDRVRPVAAAHERLLTKLA